MPIKLLFAAALFVCTQSFGLTVEQARALALGESDARLAALAQVLPQADAQAASYIQALAEDAVRVSGDHFYVVRPAGTTDAISGSTVDLPADAQEVVNNNRMRGELESASAALRLLNPDAKERGLAIAALLKDPDIAKLPLIEKALPTETNADLKQQLVFARAASLLGHADPALRLEAAKALASSSHPGIQVLLNDRMAIESDAKVKARLQASLDQVKAGLGWGERLGTLFTGLSLGSILLLAALGLAITYGLMGVINMAHGELIMVGAYATYATQWAFRKYVPGAFDAYLLAAIPVSFAAAAGVGALMERWVIRHLYGRPLETLLATWGISLMLMQSVRTLFGAQNVGVENPSWMSGGLTVLPNLVLPYNRMGIMAFSILVLALVAFLINRTRLGLFVRGVTQNRPMASAMGVNTARIDTYAFALGSGIAGLAGCALSQVGNVGPDLGQSYIVDSFMVVVLGGVGQLSGAVVAALGLGVLNKLLEGWVGAVLAKIAVLVFIIVFIQKRPQGIFALKGRSLEA